MGTSLGTLYFLSLFAAFMPLLLSFVSYKTSLSAPYLRLGYFWCSLMVMVSLEYYVGVLESPYAALVMIGWVWPLYSFGKVIEDLLQLKIFEKWHYMLLGGGAFISLALASYAFNFLSFTLPFALAYLVVGGHVLYKSILHSQLIDRPLHLVTYIVMGIFILNRGSFVLREKFPALELIGPVIDLLVIISLSTHTLSLIIGHAKEQHERELDKLIKERSEKLFGQSKYYDLGMMSAGVAHEINNPLAIIQAKTTQLLRLTSDPKKQNELREGLNQILVTSERINRTIQGVREFVHQDERMPDTNIDVKELMEDVLAFCSQRMKNHGVNLRFYGLDNQIVRGHKIQLEQVILNLFNNAFDAIEFLPDKWIEVSVQKVDEHIQIFVKDSGQGIDPEISTHMMEPFFTTKEVGKGTGLGLALAKGIIEKHGGQLKYVPHMAHTTFMIELPAGELEQRMSRSSLPEQFLH